MRRTPMRRVSKKGRSKKEMHALWRLAILATYGERCSASGVGGMTCGGGLQAHHIYKQGSHPRLRYDIENGIPACRNHHLYWIEKAPANEVYPWLLKVCGQERLDRLSLRSKASRGAKQKMDLEAIRVYLERLADPQVHDRPRGNGVGDQ